MLVQIHTSTAAKGGSGVAAAYVIALLDAVLQNCDPVLRIGHSKQDSYKELKLRLRGLNVSGSRVAGIAPEASSSWVIFVFTLG
jgi:hypothetical protein